MDNRFEELKERLVAPGRPADHFSCSELHELYDGISAIEEKLEKAEELLKHWNQWARIVPMAIPNCPMEKTEIFLFTAEE